MFRIVLITKISGVVGGVVLRIWNIGKCWIWRLLMKGINSRQIPYQYSATTAIKVPRSEPSSGLTGMVYVYTSSYLIVSSLSQHRFPQKNHQSSLRHPPSPLNRIVLNWQWNSYFMVGTGPHLALRRISERGRWTINDSER